MNYINKLKIKGRIRFIYKYREHNLTNENFNLNALNEDRTVDLDNYKNVDTLYLSKIGYRVLAFNWKFKSKNIEYFK